MTLEGKKIAILIAPRGTEDVEFAKPKQAVEDAGGTVVVIGSKAGSADTVNGDLDPGNSYTVDKAVSDVSASDFDGLVIPGGSVGADKLRGDDKSSPSFTTSSPSRSRSVSSATALGSWSKPMS